MNKLTIENMKKKEMHKCYEIESSIYIIKIIILYMILMVNILILQKVNIFLSFS